MDDATFDSLEELNAQLRSYDLTNFPFDKGQGGHHSGHDDNPVMDALRRAMLLRRYLRSDDGKRDIHDFVDPDNLTNRAARRSRLDPPTGESISVGKTGNVYTAGTSGVGAKLPGWLNDALDGEPFVLDDHMGDIAAQRAVMSTKAELGPHEPIAPEGVVWFPNPMNLFCRFVNEQTSGMVASEFEGPRGKKVQEELMAFFKNSLPWMTHESDLSGNDILAGIAWKVTGDMVTLVWLAYPFYQRYHNISTFYAGNTVYTAPQGGKYGPTEAAMDLVRVDHPAHDVFPMHYWTCRVDSDEGLPRPDQPDSPNTTPTTTMVYESTGYGPGPGEGTSKLVEIDVDAEMCEKMDCLNWFMISFGCELIRLMGQEITVRAPIERSTVGRVFQREVKKELGEDRARRGVRTFVVRRLASERNGDEATGVRPRGPLTTQHHRRGTWRVLPKRHGDLNCSHRYKGSSVRGTWRICQDCHRGETWVTDSNVGPEDAPWAYAVKVGLVTR